MRGSTDAKEVLMLRLELMLRQPEHLSTGPPPAFLLSVTSRLGFSFQTTQVQISTLPFPSQVTSGKPFNL